MPLPDALRKQVDEANALHKKVYGEGSVAQFPTQAPETPQSPPEAPQAPAPQEAPQAPQAEGEVTPPVELPTDDQPLSGAQEVPELADDEATWEQRFKSFKGRVDKNLDALQKERDSLADQLKSTQFILSSIGNAPTATPPVAQPQAQPQAPSRQVGLTQEEIEPYGEDMYQFVKKVVASRVDPLVSTLQQENARLKQELGGVSNQVAHNQVGAYRAEVARLIPNYREIMADPLFTDWADEVDKLSGVPRGYALQAAADAFDANRTAEIFNLYLQSQAKAPLPPQLSSPAGQPKRDLTNLVAPGTPRSRTQAEPTGAGSVEEEGDRTYTAAEVSQFYDDVVKGKYKNRPQLKDKIEAQIHKAVTSGRYRP